MNETVKLLLSLSLSGSILALLIFAIKPFIKNKVSKSIQYYLWMVVILRLIIPFSFEDSFMNNVFYSDKISLKTTTEGAVQPLKDTGEYTINSSREPSVHENSGNVVDNSESYNIKWFWNILNNYILYIWLSGVIIAIAINLIGYIKFLKYLKQGNIPATDGENGMVATLLNGRKRVCLVRNRFVATPMLIGILRPSIIIPNIDFNEKQLKNILLHEMSHLRRYDITIKWITMISTSIHWFNPLMYFIKKEINNACELACDEFVIKNFNSEEKQAYGDTLISVVAEQKYPNGVLQATMCEEKKSLKERLVSIMNHNKKSISIIILSVVLLGVVTFGALYLGAGVGTSKDTPPNIYISAEYMKTKVARIGTYSWSYRGRHVNADSDHTVNFEYRLDNVVSVTGKEQLIIDTQRLKKDKKYDFTIEDISVYKEKELIEFETSEPTFTNGSVCIQAPSEQGEYIYTMILNFKDRGTVSYGFVVRVDMLTYNLEEISKYKTPYIGDASKVGYIAGLMPVPQKYFKQHYTSMETKDKPYKLTIYYELLPDIKYEGEWPIVTPNSIFETNCRTNALVAFAMIDNLDVVTFAFRDSQSHGRLDESKYNTTFTFPRAAFEEKYGDLTVLGNDLDLLQDVLAGKKDNIKDSKLDISAEERRRMDLYVAVMKSVFSHGNGGNEFIAVDLKTLKGLSDNSKKEILKALTTISQNVYSFEKVKNDSTKFEVSEDGSLVRAIDGTLLSIGVEEYSENKAIIRGVSWFGNLGAVIPTYEATFKDGVWKLKVIEMMEV
ncbi:M56 family metallopeptidase [Oceanirhabdus sp. W0125-5]|uniref:M56 family metallopeptidase n=1 Tax=Oceanirhabdus sp. W0125-5 TaxID=2999116 RepID=UPI0022F2B59F|nr:M56 family metallopeptidase [Oceanirhabdus sp. W0125-5]WBW95663.1 M56 family metallopeptidase [Oceanirhabdus sp. W0125-5]